jgi:EAL and modified HD-GYP domain-containing signal transduction protein
MTLGYRPLWNRSRELAGVQLFVHDNPETTLDSLHLLRTLEELWSAESPPLLLSVQSRALLSSLLEQAPAGAPWFEVPGAWASNDAGLRARVLAAHRRGLKMVWRDDVRRQPPPDIARCFERRLQSLQTDDTLAALQSIASRRAGQKNARPSPVQPGQIYEGIASRALADHCLDQQGAWALAGWPAEDVLHAYRYQALQPSHRVCTQLLLALDTEQPMERLEQLVGEEPILAYRLLTFVNSAALGLRTGIGSIRHALMMMGVNSLKTWLVEQLPHASTDADLQPVRAALVLRARMTENLMDAGIEEDLRREVYLCGLFSQLDLLLDEPLPTILHRLPLSDRIHSATVLHTGPYAGSLQVATALESSQAGRVLQIAAEHEMETEEVNRALLRMLSNMRRPT